MKMLLIEEMLKEMGFEIGTCIIREVLEPDGDIITPLKYGKETVYITNINGIVEFQNLHYFSISSPPIQFPAPDGWTWMYRELSGKWVLVTESKIFKNLEKLSPSEYKKLSEVTMKISLNHLYKWVKNDLMQYMDYIKLAKDNSTQEYIYNMSIREAWNTLLRKIVKKE